MARVYLFAGVGEGSRGRAKERKENKEKNQVENSTRCSTMDQAVFLGLKILCLTLTLTCVPFGIM